MQERGNTDYIFNFWTALGWTVLTLGFYDFYVFYGFYQLVRRMRDHNARRLELLDAAVNFGWEEAGRRGAQEELTPSSQRAALPLAVLRKMTGDFREPVIWTVLSVVASGIVHVIGPKSSTSLRSSTGGSVIPWPTRRPGGPRASTTMWAAS